MKAIIHSFSKINYKSITDKVVFFVFLFMFTLWLAKYFFPDNSILMRFEYWLGSDKPLHLTLGFLVPICCAWLFRLYNKSIKLQFFYFIFIAAVFSLDEYFQSWVSYRSSNWEDLLMSITGWAFSVVTWSVCIYFNSLMKKNV